MTPTKTQISENRLNEILIKTNPFVMNLMGQFRNELGGRLPEELSYGIVAGFLRGNGFTWEESLISMDKYIHVMKTYYKNAIEEFNGEIKISGTENRVAIDFKNEPPPFR